MFSFFLLLLLLLFPSSFVFFLLFVSEDEEKQCLFFVGFLLIFFSFFIFVSALFLIHSTSLSLSIANLVTLSLHLSSFIILYSDFLFHSGFYTFPSSLFFICALILLFLGSHFHLCSPHFFSSFCRLPSIQ